jgi:hypothetical protein
MWNIMDKFAQKLNLDMDYIKRMVKGVNIYLFFYLMFVLQFV